VTTPASIAWDHPAPFTREYEVKTADIDGLQHTNNTVYVKWCEQAAWAHSVALGLNLDRYRQLDRAMAIRRSEYDYLQASQAGDKVIAGTWITGWDRRLTMLRRFQIVRPADGVTLLRGSMHFVCIQISTGRPRRMPAAFIEGYGPAVLELE